MENLSLNQRTMNHILAERSHPVGRPPLLTSEIIEQFCDLIIEGKTIDRAAQLTGVSPTSMYRWLSLGKKENPEPIYKELVERVAEAPECSEFELLQSMRRAGSDQSNWRANAWLLERRFPEKYGKRENQVVFIDPYPKDDGESGHLAVVS